MDGLSDGEEEFKDWQDFTLASELERFTASIEQTLRNWAGSDLDRIRQRPSGTGTVRLRAALLHNLPFRRGTPYQLTLHLPPLEEPTSGISHIKQTGASPVAPLYAPAGDEGLDLSDGDADGISAAPVVELRTSQQPSEALPGPDPWCVAGAWPVGGSGLHLRERQHPLQQWFAVDAFVTLAPQSYTGRVLSASTEAATLISALSLALSSCGAPWPAFVPVHDALRNAWHGVAALAAASVFFDSDSVHTGTPPTQLIQVEGQLQLLAARLESVAAPAAARCAAVLSGTELEAGGLSSLPVTVSARRSYVLPLQPPADWPLQGGDMETESKDPTVLWVDDWDEGAPWLPWASHSDPLGSIEVELAWDNVRASEAVYNDDASFTPERASTWRLYAIQPQEQRRTFCLQATEIKRPYLRLHPVPTTRGAGLTSPGRLPTAAIPGDDDSDPAVLPSTTFGSMLAAASTRRLSAAETKSIGQLASEDWWQRQGTQIPGLPPDSFLQDVLRDLFAAPALPPLFGSRLPQPQPQLATAPDRTEASERYRVQRTAPHDSLFGRLALHSLVFSNPRAVASLWSRFVRELRFQHWETLTPLPRMSGAAEVLLNLPEACLLYQKLQMLQLCILRRRDSSCHATTHRHSSGNASEPQDSWGVELDFMHPIKEPSSSAEGTFPEGGRGQRGGGQTGQFQSESDYDSASEGVSHGSDGSLELRFVSDVKMAGDGNKSSMNGVYRADANQSSAVQENMDTEDCYTSSTAGCSSNGGDQGTLVPVGVVGPLGANMMLHRHPSIPINLPFTQVAPAMTEDMQAERESMLASLGEDEAGRDLRARLTGALLASDMAAFKAANPGACFEDLVRWLSPRDWTAGSTEGGALSLRMAQKGGLWQTMWDAAVPQQAAEQKPLMDAQLEGERALHHLETAAPVAVLDQLLSTAAAAAAPLLSACPGGQLPSSVALLDSYTCSLRLALEQQQSAGEQRGEAASLRTSFSHGFAPLDSVVVLSLADALSRAEQAVVAGEAVEKSIEGIEHAVADAGESLCRRLAGNKVLAEALLSRAIDPWAVQGSHGTHLQHPTDGGSKSVSQSNTSPHINGEAHLLANLVCVRVTAADEQAPLDWLMHNNEGSRDRSSDDSSLEGTGTWGVPVLSELVVQVPHAAAGRPDGGLSTNVLCSRSYVRQVPGETRLSTVLVSDDT